MTSRTDPDRLIRAFLEEGQTYLPARTYAAVRAEIDRTRQKVVIGPWRKGRMNNVARLAFAAAALVVVAVLGFNLRPAEDRVAGPAPSSSGSSAFSSPTTMASPSPSPSPSATPSPSPSLTPRPADAPPGFEVVIGRNSTTVEGIPFSFVVSTPDWVAPRGLYISKSTVPNDVPEAVIYWTTFRDAVYTNPCGRLLASSVAESTADLAAALAALPGTQRITGPSDVTVGGHPATRVVFAVDDENAGCNPGFLFLWTGGGCQPCWRSTQVGDWVRVWIVDMDATRLFIVAETHQDAGREMEEEIEQIVTSIQFG